MVPPSWSKAPPRRRPTTARPPTTTCRPTRRRRRRAGPTRRRRLATHRPTRRRPTASSRSWPRSRPGRRPRHSRARRCPSPTAPTCSKRLRRGPGKGAETGRTSPLSTLLQPSWHWKTALQSAALSQAALASNTRTLTAASPATVAKWARVSSGRASATRWRTPASTTSRRSPSRLPCGRLRPHARRAAMRAPKSGGRMRSTPTSAAKGVQRTTCATSSPTVAAASAPSSRGSWTSAERWKTASGTSM
mmetsp:Transcript_109309/g.296461  ORF Transcript_109309/g.296461 Transcript_109309/m.296461 type:complete len:248 (+) Transcript_109309:388-1131(+)